MSEPGIATVVCYECGKETENVVGSLGLEETEEGRIFYPVPAFECPGCGESNFAWLEFWDSGQEA